MIGSNLFNTLMVVGLAGVVAPFDVEPAVLTRDVAAMGAASVLLLCFAFRRRGAARITRAEGIALLACFVAYTTLLLLTA